MQTDLNVRGHSRSDDEEGGGKYQKRKSKFERKQEKRNGGGRLKEGKRFVLSQCRAAEKRLPFHEFS
jgi:hypothetical protein